MTLDAIVMAVATANILTNLPAASPAQVADAGRVRVGGSCRILPAAASPAQVVDAGRVRVGGSCRILPQALGRT